MSPYVRKTERRRYDERRLSVRAVHREPPDLNKLCEALIRLTLQEIGQARMESRRAEPPETYRAADTSEGRTEPRQRDQGQRSTGASEHQRRDLRAGKTKPRGA